MKRYTARAKTAYEHAWEIRDAYRFRVFEDQQVRADFRRFLGGRAWTHAEGPGALFDHGVAWLRRNRLLLAGITVLTRLVTTVRDAAAGRMYALLASAAADVEPMAYPLRWPGGREACEANALAMVKSLIHTQVGEDNVAAWLARSVCQMPVNSRAEHDWPGMVRHLKSATGHDMTVGGADLAGQPIKAGLVDELQLFLVPVVVGGGKRALPNDVRSDLELLDIQRFASGVVYLRYRPKSRDHRAGVP